MAVFSKYYIGTPGATGFSDPVLSNVTILHVARRGTTHYQTFNETAENLQYIYSAFSGGISFNVNDPFSDFVPPDSADFRMLDKIFVKWKV